MRVFHCSRCAERVFFDNVSCGSCGASLGFVPDEAAMVSFSVEADGTWRRLGPDGASQRPCKNYVDEHVCNWMVPAGEQATPYCASCRTTEIIPALCKPENRVYWAKLERAKQRLFFTLLGLGLPAPGRDCDPQHGLWFRFLEDTGPHKRVLTGHEDGVITLNIGEADDAQRETTRAAMGEPYRTLLGHFRHESGHYYWDRLIKESRWLGEFRTLFGDERFDYAQALQKHYANPPAQWSQTFISAYASSHPWEDWAECWAHYLHMLDGLETAAAWGLRLDNAVPGAPPVQPAPVHGLGASLAGVVIEHWLPVSQFVNAMNRSLGTQDSYPFIVPPAVVHKLDFVHRVVRAAARGEVPMNFRHCIDAGSVVSDAPA